MLKGISPLLGADVLQTLAAMGHGDDLILADMNFPADSIARETTIGRLLTISNVSAAEAAAAVLSVYPLDQFVEDRAGFMESEPKTMLPVHREVQKAIRAAKEPAKMTGIERFAFYERAKKAYAVILTGEARGYANFAFRKGVIISKR
jgi:L-fucose mutarotase